MSEDEIREVDVDRRAMIDRLTARYRRALEKSLRIEDVTYDDIEGMAQKIGEEVKRSIEDETAHAQGTGYVGTRLSCPLCSSGAARYAGDRNRQVISLTGCHMFVRSYYHCRICGHGWCPLDGRLEVSASVASRRVRSLSARFCSYLPFRLAAEEMSAVCGVELSATAVQRYAKAIGARVQARWAHLEGLARQRRVPPSAERPTKLQLTMDGVMISVDGEWREAKLGSAYQLASERDGGGARDARFYATLEPSASFGRRMQVLAHLSGSDRCGRIGVVADGAEWIWQETAKYWPRCVQALDYYHACEHLWDYAKARFGEGSSPASLWIDEQKALLLEDHAADVLGNVCAWRPRKKAKRELQRKLIEYLRKHERRMQYKSVREAGHHIGSGVAEAGCKTVVQARMKGSGMRWGKSGAEAMLHLCAVRHSKDGGDFMAYTN
jgi:hypothetical protein